jgi:hypothetical protein
MIQITFPPFGAKSVHPSVNLPISEPKIDSRREPAERHGPRFENLTLIHKYESLQKILRMM